MTTEKPAELGGHTTLTSVAPPPGVTKSTAYVSPDFVPPRRPAHDPVLSEKVATLADLDVEHHGPLQPASFVPALLREVGDVWATERGLIRPEHDRGITRTAAPARLVSDVLHFHDPDILKRVLPSDARLAFALRMWIISAFAHSVFRLGARPYLDGTVLSRHWERLPEAGRAIFPDHFAAAFDGLCRLSPDGEIALDRNGGPRLTHQLGHALLIAGQLAAFLTEGKGK